MVDGDSIIVLLPSTFFQFLETMIFPIVLGLIIWLAVPKMLQGTMKKSKREALTMVCKIIGIAIIVWTVVKHII